jgi:heat shock protein HslJ
VNKIFMNNKVLIALLSLIALVLLGIGVSRLTSAPDETQTPIIIATTSPAGISETTSPKDATYTIDGHRVTLSGGLSVADAAPGSATKITTRYFGNDVTADLDGDGRRDTAFILTQNSGGSGTFYYAVAALNTPKGYVGSEGVLLGDRISPQATTMGSGTIIIFNYADRKPSESFAIAPSVGKSMWLKLNPNTMQFGEVEQNFSGEANPAQMRLNMKTWYWVNTTDKNGSTTVPRVQNKFTLTFTGAKTFSAATDCNGVGGEYTTNGASITFSRMMSTLMFCENSQEGEYTQMFSNAQSYHFTSKGELIIDLKSGGGSFIFK